jgi:dihydroorotate dehydrogenase electron transfer subunit
MQTGQGHVIELILQDGFRSARLACSGNLIPSPGQYLLAGDDSSSLLPVPLFYTDSAPSGFIAAPPLPDSWNPGHKLHLRGPLGRGFALPASSRRVALVAYDATPARLRGLLRPALNQNAAVVLVCDSVSDDLPDDVEVQPSSAFAEVFEWANYIALDVARENLSELRQRLGNLNQFPASREAQVLVRTPVPCGGLAECGVCAVTLKSNWMMACKDGPVFDWRDIWE